MGISVKRCKQPQATNKPVLVSRLTAFGYNKSNKLNANNKMSDFDSKLYAFFNKLDDRMQNHFPNMLAETAVESFKENFKTKSFDGAPWKAYGNPKREPKRGSLMMRTNALFGSIKPSHVSASLVTISAGGSRVPYAKIHNEGGRVSGTRNIGSYTNRNFMGKGKAVQIRAHTRKVDFTMPKRQYMGKSLTLLETVKNRFKTLLKD